MLRSLRGVSVGCCAFDCSLLFSETVVAFVLSCGRSGAISERVGTTSISFCHCWDAEKRSKHAIIICRFLLVDKVDINFPFAHADSKGKSSPLSGSNERRTVSFGKGTRKTKPSRRSIRFFSLFLASFLFGYGPFYSKLSGSIEFPRRREEKQLWRNKKKEKKNRRKTRDEQR